MSVRCFVFDIRTGAVLASAVRDEGFWAYNAAIAWCKRSRLSFRDVLVDHTEESFYVGPSLDECGLLSGYGDCGCESGPRCATGHPELLAPGFGDPLPLGYREACRIAGEENASHDLRGPDRWLVRGADVVHRIWGAS
jgi:hypothetical protein